jgi:hypothetical protein
MKSQPRPTTRHARGARPGVREEHGSFLFSGPVWSYEQ